MKRMLVLCAVLAVLSAGSALGDQDLLLSKKSKGFNNEVAFAVNPNTGDLLVAWTRQLRDPSRWETWVSLAKRKANGKYKKGKARKLLPSGVRNDVLPRVAWVEENGEYFVVWERRGSGRGVFGHAVTAAGNPTGDPVSLATDGMVNATPVVTASESGGIRVYYGSAPLTEEGLGRWKMKSLGLSKEYAVEERDTLSKAKKKTDLFTVNDVVELSALADQKSEATQSIHRTGRDEDDCVVKHLTEADLRPSGSKNKHFLCLCKGGEVGECQPVESAFQTIKAVPGAPSLFQVMHGRGRQITFSSISVTNECTELNITSQEQPILAIFAEALFPQSRQSRQPRVAPEQRAQDGAFGYLLTSETDGQVWEQAFGEDLNLLGNQDVVFDHGGTLSGMLGGNVPGSLATGKKSNSFLVWRKNKGNGLQEIRAHFFYLEPVD